VTQDQTIFGATTTAAEVIAGVALAGKRAIVTGAPAGPHADGRIRIGAAASAGNGVRRN